jgi:hypothetical protein
MGLSTHNVEQMARGYLMYQLAKRGFMIQLTDSRFPKYDMLVVSPNNKHFGIDVKGQRTKNFWRFKEPMPNDEMYYAFIYVPENESPRVFIIDNKEAAKLWNDYKTRIESKGNVKENDYIWGINWTTVFDYEDNYKVIPE